MSNQKSLTRFAALLVGGLIAGGLGTLGAMAADSGPVGLAQTSYPKFRGDLQNTGRSSGSGATGEKK